MQSKIIGIWFVTKSYLGFWYFSVFHCGNPTEFVAMLQCLCKEPMILAFVVGFRIPLVVPDFRIYGKIKRPTEQHTHLDDVQDDG